MSEDMREAYCAAVHYEETDLQRIHRREKKGNVPEQGHSQPKLRDAQKPPGS